MTPTDNELQTEFRDFVHARYTSLVRAGFVLTGDRGDAEDLVQSALIRCYHAWSRGSTPESQEAYVRKAMMRLAIRRSRRPAPVPQEAFMGETADWTPDAVSRLDLHMALLGLPMKSRVVLVLRYYCDLSEREVAETLGCSTGTVKSRTSRAIAQLRASRSVQMGPYEEVVDEQV